MQTSPPRTPGPAGDSPVAARLVATASDLFYREGIQAVGIQRVIEEAGVAKASLYAHFASKDDLVAACLQRRSDDYRARVDAELAALANPVEKILRLFDAAAEWMGSGEFRGCPFANAEGELASPSHPARVVVAAHFDWFLAVLVGLVRAAGRPQPERLAGALANLLQGAAARALADGSPRPAQEARWAAEALLAGSAPARSAARPAKRTPVRRARTTRR